MRRTLHRVMPTLLPLLGMGIIFGSVLFQYPRDVQAQMGFMIVGVLLLEAGVWGLASQILPSERRYHGLRTDGDHMIDLIRSLNAAAIAAGAGKADDESFQDTLVQMHASEECMAGMAGNEAGAT